MAQQTQQIEFEFADIDLSNIADSENRNPLNLKKFSACTTVEDKKPEMAEFEVKVSTPNDLKTFFALAKVLSEELTVEVVSDDPSREQGLVFRTLDPSHVGLIDVVMSSRDFEKWEITNQGNFHIRTEEVYKLVKLFDKKDSVSMSVKDMMLIFKTKTSTEKIRLIEKDESKTPLPHITFNAMATITLKDLKNMLKRIGLVSEYITFDMHENKLDFIGIGDSGETKLTLEKGMAEMPEFDLRENSKSTYSLEYINEFLKCFTDNCSMTLNYSTKMPLRFSTRLNDHSTIDFYLAPRVEN